MRVIAGTARGRPLTAPPGRQVRPTSDRVREALFSTLGPVIPGARVLDLFAGSGALAVEALSRGAASAVLVDKEVKAVAAIRANLQRTGLAAAAVVARVDAERFCRQPRDGPFDVVLVDPPYTESLTAVISRLEDLHGAGGLVAGATVVVERDRRDASLAALRLPSWLAETKRRSYGDTVLLYLRVDEQEPSP